MKNSENEMKQGGNNSECSSASNEASGSELCSVLLGVYDSAQSRHGSGVVDEGQALVSAVLSSLLALSHCAKTTALQGEDKKPCISCIHPYKYRKALFRNCLTRVSKLTLV